MAATNQHSTLRQELGQFFTPQHIADLMASMFFASDKVINLLDPGAGEGALTFAFVKLLCQRPSKPKQIRVVAFEIDPTFIPRLQTTLRKCRQMCKRVAIDFQYEILRDDFVPTAVVSLRKDFFSPELPQFNIAILNPPYRKLRSDSKIRSSLRSIGIEATNFYSAFVALSLRLLGDGAELVAITPRSFCNGPYFEHFRKELLKASALHRLHLFGSRAAAFRKDKVLQENVVLHVVKGGSQPEKVLISSSTGKPDAQVEVKEVPFLVVVSPHDPERFIHIDIDADGSVASFVTRLSCELSDLNLTVSTGRVVDFRSKRSLRHETSKTTVPLIYPNNFNGGFVEWPNAKSRKPKAILMNGDTKDLLVPMGFYVLVKRFSAKEERRRIVASTFDPKIVRSEWVGFENHLNYFHSAGNGLTSNFAKGLTLYLNSTAVDSYFRQFSGHTQVNATDLRKLKYPSRAALEKLGQKCTYSMCQEEIDQLLNEELFHGTEEARCPSQEARSKAERISGDSDKLRFRSKAV